MVAANIASFGTQAAATLTGTGIQGFLDIKGIFVTDSTAGSTFGLQAKGVQVSAATQGFVFANSFLQLNRLS
jgi:hypothetical protein